MKKHDVTYMIAVAALSVTLLSGCANERMEDELGFRDIGIADMQKGDYDGAIVAFGSALAQCAGEITDTEIDICYYKAAALYASGDTQGAYDTYQALIDYNKDDGNAYYLMGCLDLQNGNTDTAVSNFEKAVSCNKNDYKLYIGIYEDLAAYNMKEQGEEYLNKAFDIKGNSADDLTNRGRIYYLLGQYDNAKEELAAAIKKESKEANLYLAQVYEAEGDSEQAETYYQAYTDSGIADSTAMNALAEIEMGRGNYASALNYIKQGLAMENVPNRAMLLSNQIIACEYTGDFATAWEVVQEYITLCPDDAAAQREYIFLKNRQVKQTVKETPAEDTQSTEAVPSDTESTQ